MRAWAPLIYAGAILSVAFAGDFAFAADGKTAFDHARLARQSLDGYIRPGYRRFADATRALDEAISAHCGRSESGGRRKIDGAFDAVVTAWGRIEFITFGPVTVEQRLERIMFWPDRRGIGARQVAAALRNRSPDVLDVDHLSKKSVAMQGLPALETVLFGGAAGKKADDQALRFRCGFAKAIAANLANMAQSIEKDWSSPDGFAQSWLTPGHDNPNFIKPSETTLAIAKAFDQGLEKVRDQRLAGPLGLTAQQRKIAPALGKSGRSMRLIGANIAGLRELYVQGGMEQALIDANSHDRENATALAKLVSKELVTAGQTATELMSVKAPFQSRASQQRIIALGFPLKNARTTAAGLLDAVTDLPMGFNASDGD
jgi:predicted lipoprotein